MGVKRIVDTDFWTDIDVIDKYSIDDKFFALYLLTNKYSRQAGIYKLPKRYISFETGYSKEVVEVLLERFEKSYNKIRYNHETQEIALLKYTSFSIVKGGKPVEDCIKKDLREVKDKELIKVVYDTMQEYWTLSSREFDSTVKEIFKNSFEIFLNDNDNVFDNDNDNDNDNENERNVNDSLERVKQAKETTYYKNVDLDDAVKEFIKHRKMLKKTMTPYAVKRFINKLNREFETDDEKLEAIDMAIERGWLSVEKAWVNNAKKTIGGVKTIADAQKDAEQRWGGFLNA